MCEALLNATALLDPSPQLIVSLAASLGQSYSPAEVSDERVHEMCSEALTSLSDLMAMGYLKSAGVNAALIVANTISKFVNSHVAAEEGSDQQLRTTSSPTGSPTSVANLKEAVVLDAVATLETGLLSMMVLQHLHITHSHFMHIAYNLC
jgi:hypothetical protein